MSEKDWIPIDQAKISYEHQYEVTTTSGYCDVMLGSQINRSLTLAIREYKPTPYKQIGPGYGWRFCTAIGVKQEGDMYSIDKGETWHRVDEPGREMQRNVLYRRRIDVGYGWRMLGEKELLQDGDEFQAVGEAGWNDKVSVGKPANHLGFTCRRRIDVGYGFELIPECKPLQYHDWTMWTGTTGDHSWFPLCESNPPWRTGYVYRRLINPGEDYELVPEKEPLEDGDDVRGCGNVWHSIGIVRCKCKGEVYRRRIKPKYRPFAGVKEYIPHKDKWLIHKTDRYWHRLMRFGDSTCWEDYFDRFTFEDGTPFGVEVKP